MSSCFARQVVRDIRFEGKGNEALLEILVKVNNNKKYSNVPVKEIPIKQHDALIIRNLSINRIFNYSRAIWELYRYGKESKLENDRAIAAKKT